MRLKRVLRLNDALGKTHFIEGYRTFSGREEGESFPTEETEVVTKKDPKARPLEPRPWRRIAVWVCGARGSMM
jgi:hypothetical protein